MEGKDAQSMKFLQFALSARTRNTVLLCLIALFVFLIRVSYSPTDSAWSHASNLDEVSNMLGRLGAVTVDFLIRYLGDVVFLIPGLLIFKVVAVLSSTRQPPWWFGPISFLGFALTLCSLCVLFALWYGGSVVDLQHYGGSVGMQLVLFLQPQLGTSVLALFSMFSLFLGLCLALRFSWIRVVEYMGVGVRSLSVASFVIVKKFMTKSPEKKPKAEIREINPQPKSESTTTKPRKSARKQKRERRASRSKTPKTRVAPVVGNTTRAKVAASSVQKSKLPSLKLLQGDHKQVVSERSMDSINRISEELATKLADFGVESEVVSITSGPVVTRFELQLAPGIKVSKVSNLVKDLARALAVTSVRVVEIIPGKSVIGIEIPNDDRSTVYLKQVLESSTNHTRRSPLTLVLGKDVAGSPVFADIERMPHLLVAGTTGSGKSVCINVMLVSLLLNATPEQVRLILIDPKMLELSTYEGIPHLLTPVVTDMQEASYSLKWCIAEMERRYQLMAALGVRNLTTFNSKINLAESQGKTIPDPLRPFDSLDQPEPLKPLPLIVVIVDEFADMMMIVGKKVEQLIARLAQKARAAGIHLVLATQRPSVDVITGLIKANVPSRISFQVSSQIDSRTILDQGGAEQLLGHGDMLYLPTGSGVPIRVHGAFVSDSDVKNITDSWRKIQQPEYVHDVTAGTVEATPGSVFSDESNEIDDLYNEAVSFVVEKQKVSISSVQRKLRVGYNRAARMVEAMEDSGIVSETDTQGNRRVLVASV